MKPFTRNALKYLPIAPLLALIWYSAAIVQPYPAQIKVKERSCADPANGDHITFRQATYCVTPAERQIWDNMWLTSYVLMFVLVASVGFIRIALPRERRGS